jgi:hypothetical protein
MIVYAVVSRGKTVLAEYTFTSGNFPTITRVLLGKIPEEDGKMSYVYDQFVFHYVVENKITFLCMADENAKRRVPFAFLDDIKVRERARSAQRARGRALCARARARGKRGLILSLCDSRDPRRVARGARRIASSRRTVTAGRLRSPSA